MAYLQIFKINDPMGTKFSSWIWTQQSQLSLSPNRKLQPPQEDLIAAFLWCLWYYFNVLLIQETVFNYCMSLQVPKYLSQQWDKAGEKGEVGKVTIGKYVPQHLCSYWLYVAMISWLTANGCFKTNGSWKFLYYHHGLNIVCTVADCH